MIGSRELGTKSSHTSIPLHCDIKLTKPMIFHTFPGAVNLFLFAGQISSLPSGSIGSIHSDLSSEIPCAEIDVYHMFGLVPYYLSPNFGPSSHSLSRWMRAEVLRLFVQIPSESFSHSWFTFRPTSQISFKPRPRNDDFRFHRLHLLPLTNPDPSSRVNPQQPPQPNAHLLFLA